MSRFPELQELLQSNETWSRSVDARDATFFTTSSQGQAPKILWYGCSDSRVPESVITERKPGEIFVHRNIANQFRTDDDSANAVLEFAVNTVGITHVVVVGHTSCGGCVAAHGSSPPISTSDSSGSPLIRFLGPLIRLRHSLPIEASLDELIEENVKLSVKNVVDSEVIKNAWSKASTGGMREVYVHGWVYDLATGRLRDLGITQGPKA